MYAQKWSHFLFTIKIFLPLAPLEKWKIDYIRPITPHSSWQNQYIIVATKYLTKWAEAKPLKVVDGKQTAIFLYENVISRFGSPKIFVSNWKTHFPMKLWQ